MKLRNLVVLIAGTVVCMAAVAQSKAKFVAPSAGAFVGDATLGNFGGVGTTAMKLIPMPIRPGLPVFGVKAQIPGCYIEPTSVCGPGYVLVGPRLCCPVVPLPIGGGKGVFGKDYYMGDVYAPINYVSPYDHINGGVNPVFAHGAAPINNVCPYPYPYITCPSGSGCCLPDIINRPPPGGMFSSEVGRFDLTSVTPPGVVTGAGPFIGGSMGYPMKAQFLDCGCINGYFCPPGTIRFPDVCEAQGVKVNCCTLPPIHDGGGGGFKF